MNTMKLLSMALIFYPPAAARTECTPKLMPRDRSGKTSGGHTESVAVLELESRQLRFEHFVNIQPSWVPQVAILRPGILRTQVSLSDSRHFRCHCDKSLVCLVEDRAIEIWPEFFCSEGASIDQDVG